MHVSYPERPLGRRGLSALAESFVADPDRPCPACGHRLGGHIWLATDTGPSDSLPSAGGVLVCPSAPCRCGLPWGSATEPGAFVPSAEQIAETAEFVQSQPEREPGPVATIAIWSTPDERIHDRNHATE